MEQIIKMTIHRDEAGFIPDIQMVQYTQINKYNNSHKPKQGHISRVHFHYSRKGIGQNITGKETRLIMVLS